MNYTYAAGFWSVLALHEILTIALEAKGTAQHGHSLNVALFDVVVDSKNNEHRD